MEELIVYLKIIQKRWLPASLVFAVVFIIMGWERSRKAVPLYRANGTIVFQSSTPSLTSELGLSEEKNLTNDLVLMKSDSFAEQVRNDLQLGTDVNNQNLLQNLVATNPQNTDVIQLSFTDQDPEKAAAIVNAWIENYVRLDKELEQTQTRELAQFLQQQIPQTQESLEATAEKIKDFKQNNRILDINAEASSTTEILSELDAQIAETQAQLAAQKSRRDDLRKLFQIDSDTAVTSSFINESPIVSSLIQELEGIETKIEQEKLRFGDRHPEVSRLEKEKKVLEEQLEKYLKNVSPQNNISQQDINENNIYQPGTSQSQLLVQYSEAERNIKSLEAQLDSLNDLINTYRERVDTLPSLEFEQKQLQRELTTKDEILQSLIKNYQDSQIALNNTQGNVRFVELAKVPSTPAIVRKNTYLIQGFLAGILMGSLVAYLLERLDKGVRDVEQIKEYFGQPILATIPNFFRKSKRIKQNITSDLPVRDHPSSPISESFRTLCTAIKFIGIQDGSPKNNLKVITISSSVTAEGKSTIAANMAIAASGLGSKVLLIEADLRKPGQKKIWSEKPHQKGLGDLLTTDEPFSLSQYIIKEQENLDVLFAGNNKSNPVALIGSPQMAYLIQKLRQKYDLIILDAPPVSVAADAQILARMSDGMLLVVRQGKVNTSLLSITKESLELAEVNILGLIPNCFTTDKNNYYYYYNYSYYHQDSEEPKKKIL
ncbi:polysaccharide biosynthesis tyrosine autokinase [Cyanobacterium aponinum UTEX 3222]|uniref:GumC family protein n=1 Tax=Cyanobacterium aponinum TaxID=379064 RepID=UPI003087EBAB|nr:polysaccharide biosynthesis tyrosine autokinase [Cyanobacterium aponinum UTEX 3222]